MSASGTDPRLRRLGAAASAAIVAAMFLYLAYWLATSGEPVWALLASLNPLVLAVAFLFHSGALLLGGLCWAFIMWRLGSRVPLLEHLAVYVATLAARRVPGSLWQIAGRGLYYERRGAGRLSLLASGVEYQVVLLSGIVCTLLFWPLAGLHGPCTPYFLALCTALGVALLSPPAMTRLRRLLTGHEAGPVLAYRHTLVCVGLYVLIWVLSGGILVWLLQAMAPFDFARIPAVLVAWCAGGTLGVFILFLPSGLGINELVISVVLSSIVPGPVAVFAALATRVVVTVFDLVWSASGIGLLRVMAGHGPPAD